ncbi:MAG: YitT family protein [Prevotellaceae bacterium]|nr:YitT family protein [Prevotellaceae bacterium]
MASEVRSYLGVTFGLFLYTLAWVAFLIPNKIVGGGATGMATVIAYLAGLGEDTISYFFFGINAILVVIGVRVLGRGFGTKTVYGILLVFSLLYFLPKLGFIQYIGQSFHESDKLLCAIIGGFVSGIGSAVTLLHGGSAGGTDIVAMVINKYRNITPGKVFLYADLIIVSSSFFISWDFRTIVYGYVVMAVFSYSVDLFMSGSKQSVQIFVFSKYYDLITERLTKEANRGVTLVSSQGGYTKEEGKLIVIVARKYDMSSVYHIVREVDPNAFITVANVMGVYGRGFDEYKSKPKSKPRKTINVG